MTCLLPDLSWLGYGRQRTFTRQVSPDPWCVHTGSHCALSLNGVLLFMQL